MNILTDFLKNTSEYKAFKEALNDDKLPLLISGVIDTQKSHIISTYALESGKSTLIVTHSELRAQQLVSDLNAFGCKNVFLYPGKDAIFYWADVKSNSIVQKRYEVLSRLLSGESTVVVACVDTLLDRLPPVEELKKYIFTLKVDEDISLDDLTRRLVLMGYERCDMVEGAGQFSVRGGILDIFSPVAENPVRIEFFGDTVDSVRYFDTVTQRTISTLSECTVYPARELIYDEKTAKKAAKAMRDELSGIKYPPTNLKETITEQAQLLEEELSFSGVDRFILFFYDDTVSLAEYMGDAIIFVDEPARVAEHTEFILNEFTVSVTGRIENGYMLPSQLDLLFDKDELLHSLMSKKTILMCDIVTSLSDWLIRDKIGFTVKETRLVRNNIELLSQELDEMCQKGYTVVFTAGGTSRCERLFNELTSRGVPCVLSVDEGDLNGGFVYIVKGGLTHGFEYPEYRFAVITDADLFGEVKTGRRRRKRKDTSPIKSFTELKQGDYVVHENNGIAVYKGIEQIIVDGIAKDYLKLEYAEEDLLYVSVNQMDMVQKYIGGEGAKPRLTKLGGASWQRAKEKARNSVKELAVDLVKIYASRQTAGGFKYDKDTVWQKEFEETFEFTETEDQLSAIEDVKADMEQGRVMDRLICGDVGFGKTEVAIRAAFKTVQNSKQVAFLVPTTILAKQHYLNFVKRMADFPVNIEMLSRFSTQKQQKEIVDGLKSGKIDIVIGTHKLLSKSVGFKDLGLIIVDEEQRFGVNHKEKLKQLKLNVNVLTLTATPIPRTLHMSLSGIRDMSLLEEAPMDRLPIQTYVMEYNPEFVKDAIYRELARGGQVYFLHNRVNSIVRIANELQELIPEASIAYAHGQMSERELENVMMDFIENKINVLVCTTIVETGLDIPNVNTIIISDADKMGLSQLYQLRGRVGRATRSSYAYLMYRKDKVLTEASAKRLRAIKDFTEFGSGFRIAMRDLEIRGAGNIIGAEQHGHMDAIGYELYTKMLEEAILELRGEGKPNELETLIDIKLNAYIPSSYIENELVKLEMYKKISFIKTREDVLNVSDELIDRFGEPPKAVVNLMEVAYIKAMAHSLGADNVSQRTDKVIFSFKEGVNADIDKLLSVINKYSGKLMYTQNDGRHTLTYKLNDEKTVLKELTKLLEEVI